MVMTYSKCSGGQGHWEKLVWLWHINPPLDHRGLNMHVHGSLNQCHTA